MADQGEQPGKLRRPLHIGSERAASRAQCGLGMGQGVVRLGSLCPGPGLQDHPLLPTRCPQMRPTRPNLILCGHAPFLPSLSSGSFFTTAPSCTSPTCPNTAPEDRAPQIVSFPQQVCAHVCTQLCLFATLWIMAHQAPLSMGFSRQEYWRGLPFPSSGDLSNPSIEQGSPGSPACIAGRVFTI